MSNKRITDLTELTTPTTDDVFPVVDIATNTTTKVQLGNLPVPTSVTTALATKENTITPGTTAQYYRGDKSFQTLDKTAVGLGNVDNTSDANKPVSTATQTALNAKQDTLVSGTNIKTINSTSLLGSGNITIAANPSGVAGAIQFSNGSAFASDAANLFWDDTNNRLGVGTNAPNTALDISASLTSIFTLRNGATNFITTRSSGIGGSDTGLRIWNNSNNLTLDLYGSGSYDHQQKHTFYIGGQTGERFSIGSTTAATIKGSGSTSATTSLLVQNSSGNTGLEIKDDRSFVIGNFGANGAGFGILAGNPTGAGVGGGINFNFNNGAAFNDDTNNSALKMTYNGGVRIPNSSRYPLTLGSDTKAVASAQLEMVSTTQGFLPPRMTTTQKNAIATPASGLVVYDSTTNKLCCYNGSTWNDLF